MNLHTMHRALPLALAAGSFLVPFAGAGEDDFDPPTRQEVQAGIEGGLRWLAAQQIVDGPEAGSWAGQRYRTATASFAGLAFLANGHHPGRGAYGEAAARAMRFVQASMDSRGYLGARDNTMYVHAICSLFGLSYLGLSEDRETERELAAWCRRSVALILEAQQVRKASADRGGWRYTPNSRDSDLSVTSWMLLVLHAARQCGFEVDPAVFRAALGYVNRAFVETPQGDAGFVYRPGVSRAPEPGVTGVAVCVKSLLEPEADERLRKAVAYLRSFPPAWGGEQHKGYFFFGTFYMAQGMFQLGEGEWDGFAPRLQRVLLDHQHGDGHWELPPDNKRQSHLAGTAYATALAVLILSLDKQYLPMYQRQKRLF